jgi:hypothetical protein
MLISLIAIDPETISMAFNIGFFVIIGMVVVGFLVGLIRGVWKSGFRLIFVGGLVIVAFLASRSLTDIMADLNVSALASNFGFTIPTLNMTLGESTIIVNITSIRETVASFMTQLFAAMGIDPASGTETANLIMAVVLVTIRYVVFIVLGILITTVGEMLASFLYFFPFRLIIPKSWRKKHKLRLVGGLLNAVKVALVGVMMLIPFSSIINTINQAFHNPDNGVATGVDDATYNQVMSFIDAYNDSLFAQLLFNWSVDENGKTLDTVLMDYVTGEDVGDYMVTLSGELYTIASIGQTILSTGILTNGLDTATTTALLSEDVIGSVIVNLTGSALIMEALPIAVAVAMNMEAVRAFVDPDLLDLDGISWEQELINIKEIATDVIDSGIVEMFFTGEELDPVNILLAMVEDEAYASIRSALHRIDDSEFLSQVLPAVVYKLVTDEAANPPENIGLSTFFPTDWADYEDIHFGEEIALVYDVVHQLATIDPDLLPAVFDLVGTQEDGEAFDFDDTDFTAGNGGRTKSLYRRVGNPIEYSEAQDNLIDIVRAHSDELIEIIVGQIDGLGNPVGVDPETGKTILVDEFGELLPDVSANLLDSSLVVNGLDELLDMALAPLLDTISGGIEFDRTSLDDTIEWLNGTDNGEKRFNYKGEFSAILGIISAIFNNDSLITMIFPEDDPTPEPAYAKGPKPSSIPDSSETDEGSGLLDIFEDEDFRTGFKEDICPLLDRSRIMGAVLPDVLESALAGAGMADMLDPLGLSVESLNFDFDDVGTQMAYLIDIVGYSLGLVDQIDTIFEDISPVVDDLIGLMDALFKSDIINPKDDDGLMLTDNYYDMLTSLFSQAEGLDFDTAQLDAAARTVPADGWTTTYDEEGDPLVKGENYNLIKFIETALTSDLFDIDQEGDILDQMIAFASDPDDPIGEIFDAVDSSIIISSNFGNILDTFIGDAGGLVDDELGTSFTNVTDWSAEGDNFKFVLTSLEPFSAGLENIDFLNSDADMVEDMLKALAQSQIFNVSEDEYVFSDFLLAKLKGEGSIMGEYIYDPYEDETSPSPYDIITADFHAIGQTPATAANWYGPGGEIEAIVAFVDAIQTFADGSADPIDKLQNDPTIGSVEVKPIMERLNEISSMRILLYNMFDLLLGTPEFNVGNMTPSENNSYALLSMDEDTRADEIDFTFEIYSSLEAIGLNGGVAFTVDLLTPANVNEISDMLNAMHDSVIFNTFDESQGSRSHVLGFLTLFEQVVEMVFDVSMLDTYIYAELATPEDVDDALRADVMAIPNDFTESGDPDEWIGAGGEIAAITGLLTTFIDTGLSFDDFGTDGAASFNTLLGEAGGVAKVENLLFSINDSRLAHPAIPNLFDEIFTAGAFAMDGVDLTDANTDYFRTEDDKNERATEITQLLDVYEGISDLGLTDGTPLTLAAVDGDAISTLLLDLHDSKVFNTFQDGKSHAATDLTVFEQTFKMLYTVTNFIDHIYSDALEAARPNLLRDDIIGVGNDLAGTDPLAIDGWTGLTGEIATVKNILVALKDTDIDFDAMGGAGLSGEFNTLIDTPAGKAKVETLMARINESKIAWPANPNLLEELLSADGFSISGVSLADSNPAYLKSIPIVSERQEELDQLFDIFDLIDALGVNDGTPFDDTQLDTITIDDLLNALHDSVIFNTLRDEADRLSDDLTVFEQMIWMLIDASQLDEYIYEDIGRDPTLKQDIIGIGNDFAGTDALADDGWKDQTLPVFTGEITRFIDILDAFDASGLTFTSFSDAGSSDTLSTLLTNDFSAVENMLLAMNHSEIVYPAIPNLFATMLEAGDMSIAGVDFADANTHYRGNHGNPLVDDKYLPYDDSEISQLLTIFTDAKVIAATSYSNLSAIGNDDIDNIKALAESLFESHVFHIEGVPGGAADDPTVFEQIIIKMMNDTGLSALINDTMNPNPNYYDGMVYKFANAAEKAEYLVVNYESLYGASLEHYTTTWDGLNGEINALFRIFKEIKRVLPLSAGAGAIVPSDLAPLDISAILAVLNNSDLAADAIPDLVRDAFETISFDVYTESNEDYYLTPVEYFTVDLTTMDYSDTDFTALNPPEPGLGGLIENLLAEFYDGAAYEDMGPAFDLGSFITLGHTTEPLIHLFDASLVFGNDVSGESYKTRSLAFHNILDSAGVAKYVDFTTVGSNKTTKSEKLETIFTTDFDYVFESERLDLYIVDLISFNALTDATSIDGFGSQFRALIENTYELDGLGAIVDRAYLISELSAGFYTDIFEEEYPKVLPVAPDVIDFYAADYGNLNPLEADGVEGALSILGEIDVILGGSFDQDDVDRLHGHFVKMGSLANTGVTGVYNTYNFDDYDEDGNSLIAKLFYAAEVTQHDDFDDFSTAITTYAWIDKMAVVVLNPDPYSANFVFEIEGDKINYTYS